MAVSNKLNPVLKNKLHTQFDIGRRRFGKLAFAGALSGKFLFPASEKMDSGKKMRLGKNSSIKLAVQLSSDPREEDLTFVRQLGIEYVTIGTSGKAAAYENFLRLRQKVENAGLKIWNIGNSNVHNMEEVTLYIQ